MVRRRKRPQRPAGRKQADAILDGKGRSVGRTSRRGSGLPKEERLISHRQRKVSTGRGRPAVFTREEILQTAKVAFSKAGYANITLDDLAARLNTGKGTLYYHSNRKVDLLIAISTKAVGNNATELRRIASIKAPPQQRTRARDAHADARCARRPASLEGILRERIRPADEIPHQFPAAIA